jgi:hypothetical protein
MATKFFIADMPNSSHEIILGIPLVKDNLSSTTVWQPNVFLPSLPVNINDNTSTSWTPQTAHDKETKADDIFLNDIFMNMLITTESLSKYDQVPPDRIDVSCKHVTDDLLDTDTSKMLRPPPPTPFNEPPLPTFATLIASSHNTPAQTTFGRRHSSRPR